MTSPATPPSGQPDPAALLALGLATQTADAPASSTPPLTPAELAAEFPRLDIVELLGRGGMGAVYKARQRDLDRLVALKILRPGLDADPGFAERFTREARALAQLNHPGIVTLYEFGKTSAGRYFILMEFVDGMNLRQLLAAGRLSPREALAIVPPLCDALQYAHDRGLIHRDIKPENLLIDRLGRIKIADFGIARLASERSGERERPDSETSPSATLTSVGEIIGSPHYMAPEQLTHPAAIDHRADLYALGVVLYQMLTGELPSAGQLRPPSQRVQLDVRLDEIVLRALEKDPARRYAAANDFKTQVETVAATSSTPSANSNTLKHRLHRIISSPWFRFLPVVLMLVILISTINRNAPSSGKPTAQTVVSEKKFVSTTAENQPAPDSLILPNFDPAKANEPPRLRALKWLDHLNNQASPAWLTTGEPVPATEQLPEFSGVVDQSNPDARHLGLWFSHPLFDKQSHAKITLLDHTGAPLPPPGKSLSWQTQSIPPGPNRAEGWIILTSRLSHFDDTPKNLIARLDYSLGAWTYTKEMSVNPHISNTEVLTDGTVIGSPGQNAAGKAFIETSFNPKSVSQTEQLDFVAITHNGRRLNRTSGSSQGYDELHTKRFVFDIPLSEVRAFAIRTRPIRTIEWTVPLGVNKIATDIPIELRAINWLDHAEGDVGHAWQPTGENTSNSERRPSHIGITSSAPTSPLDGDAPRYLCLWFTHPGLDSSSLISVKLLDPKTHQSLSPLGSHFAGGFHPAANGNPPWIMATVAAGLFDRMPSQASVVLTYAVGEWHFWTELPLDISARRALATGVSVSPPGQGADGQAFIEITRDRGMDTYVEQFGFVALTRDGRRLESRNRSDYTTGGTLTQRYHFDAPLEQLRAVEVRKRGISGSTWTVPLRPERMLSDERSLHLDRAGDTMANIVMRLRREHGLRLAFEDLEFEPADGITLGARLVELEAKEARNRLHSAEVRLLRDARLLRDKNKLSPETLIDVGERFYGTIRGRNTAEFLEKLTGDTPYFARRLHNTWVIEPRSASRLTYPITLDTAGLTVERALAAILARSPHTAPLHTGPAASPGTSAQAIDRQPWLHVQAPALRFESTPAGEALARLTESAVPASVWTVGGYSDRRVVTLAPAPADPSLRRIQEANTWLLSIDRGLYAESWNHAGKALQSALTAEAWNDALRTARTPLGDARSRRLLSATPTTTLPGVPDGRYLVLLFASSFANKTNAIETLTLSQDPDGVWRASGYFIR